MVKCAFLFKHNFLFILIFLLFLHHSIFAQSSEPIKHLTMEEAISRALVGNNLIKANEYSLKKANWDVKRAWAELFPTLSFDSRYNWIDKQTFAERDFRQYLPPELASQIPQTVFQESYYSSFNLNFPLFNGVLINGLSIAYEKETLSEQMTKSTKHQTIFNVISNYLNVLQNKEILSLQNDYLQLSKLNYEKAQRLFNANRYSENEALRWKIEYQQEKSSVIKSEAELRNSFLSLSRLTNTSITDETLIDQNILEGLQFEKNKLFNLTDKEILQIIELADDELIEANASLSAAKSSEEISRLLHKNSYSSFMPKINLNYSYGWRENNTIDFDDYSPKNLMVTFSLPIFSGFQNYSALKSSFYEYKKNQEEFNDQLLNIKLVLTNVVNNLINNKAQLDLTKTNVLFSENNYKVVETQREKGLVSNIDYIDAKLKLQEAGINNISTSYGFIMSIVELYYLTGKIEILIN